MLRYKRSFSWTLQSRRNIEDYKLEGLIYAHSQLGSKAIHLKSDDNHKAFAVLLKTISHNDTGVPHCLEHIVLTGSQKYPVRDPFMKMLTRSLNSYMNAWTGSDFTMYPFSTVNQKDFDNLLDVYLDAVYYPQLKKNDFLQEAWRLDFDQNENLLYKGVVFNEMKGSMSEPSSYFLHTLYKYLFEGSQYQYNSGGDPKNIVDLTHEQLIEYHRKYYHPSNSTFLMYGNMDTEEVLQKISEKFGENFQYLKIDNTIGPIPRKNRVQEIELKIPPDTFNVGKERDWRFGMSFLCNDVSANPYETLCMSILSYALFSTQNSPFYKNLLESGLGTDYIPGNGYDYTTKESAFTIGVTGMKQHTQGKVEKAILDTLSHCMQNGFDENLIQSAIHQIEIRLKQANENVGLLLISNILNDLLHGEDCLQGLEVNVMLQKLRRELSKGKPVFQDLIRKWLWENNHKIVVLTKPDEQFNQNLQNDEKARLQKIQGGLTDQDILKIKQEAEELALDQDSLQDSNLLPTLKVSDINQDIEQFDYSYSEQILGIKVNYVEQPTNGISYIRFKANLKDLPVPLQDLIPLYTRLINRLGTNKYDHGKFNEYKNLYTISGISASNNVTSNLFSLEQFEQNLVYQVAFLDRNLEPAFDILNEFFTDTNFLDYNNMSFLIQKSVKQRTDGLINEGLSYAISLASSSLTPAANQCEALGNLKHDCYLASQLLEQTAIEKILNDVGQRLQQIHNYVLNQNLLEVMIHTSNLNESLSQFQDRLQLLFNSFKLSNPNFDQLIQPVSDVQFIPFIYQAYFTIPSQVNDVAECFRTVNYTHPDFPKLTILGEILAHNYLLKEIREKGGAYGAGAKNDPHKGTFALYSYRDPNNLQTFDKFENCVLQCQDGKFTEQQVDEAKLSAFSKIDKPIACFNKGLHRFLYNLNNEMRQEYRTGVLNVSKQDVVDVCNRYLSQQMGKGLSSRVIFGVEQEDATQLESQGWKVGQPINIIKI